MLVWAAYLLVISGVMSLGALSLERAIRAHGLPLRWIWVCALIGSLALPLVLSSAREPIEVSGAKVHASPGRASRRPARMAPAVWTRQVSFRLVGSDSVRLDDLLEAIWILSSCFEAAVLVGGYWYGYRRRRRWRRASIAGTELLVAPDAGPAAVGLLRPKIVLPQWLLAATPETLRLVIAHERSHVEARDPALMSLGIGLLALMPWNALLWWQLHRLRLAIEVDCDRRVLRCGHDAQRYARILVDVSTRRPAYVGGLAASYGSFSSIERRLIIMSTPRIQGWRVGTAARTLLSLAIVMVAILISPPAIPPVPARIAGAVQPKGLGRYAGNYEIATMTVLQIRLRNGQLLGTFPGMKPQALTRASGEEFRFGNTSAHIRFALDAAGQVTALTLQQNGAATEAPRISAVRVDAIDSAVEARKRAQTATPGGEAALRRLIVGIESGNPDYAGLSPQLAAGTRALLSKLQALMKPLGALHSIDFRGIDRKGWDRYVVRFKRGTALWDIALDSHGVLVGAGMVLGSQTHPGQ